MKKILIAIFGALLIFGLCSCLGSKDCKDSSVQSEQAAMLAFANAHGLTVTQHSSGLYYQIINPGSGATPGPTSTVSVTYAGQLTDGSTFDQQTSAPVSIAISNVIAGWQFGLPLIKKGGSIRLIIPSSLGYGCHGFGVVPPNSILYFQIDLVDVM